MESKTGLHNGLTIWSISGWVFGAAVFAAGVLNLFLVHPVPGIAYLLLSLIYFPPSNNLLKRETSLSIPVAVKIILGIIIFLFTFGVSDLGDMIDKL